MSYSSWHNYGYGVCTTPIQNVSLEQLESLLDKAPRLYNSILKWMDKHGVDTPTIEDYQQWMDHNYSYGITELLSEVINEAEQIPLTACDDYNCETYLIYQPSYPWNLKSNELLLTEEGLDDIYRTYIPLLTDEELVIEHQSAENGC